MYALTKTVLNGDFNQFRPLIEQACDFDARIISGVTVKAGKLIEAG